MSGVYARYNGEWYTVSGSGGSGGSGSPAVVSGHNGATVQSGVTIDGKTYDVYTFSEATTFASVTLTTEAREAIAEAELPDTEGFTMPDGFDGDPAELIPENYREVVKDAFDVIPASDPGLSLTIGERGIVEALIVAGGGGGGGGQNGPKGGGGAGGLITTPLLVDAGTYEIKIGDSGAGGGTSSAPSAGVTGLTSIAFGLTAQGGGGGGYSPSYNTGVTTAGAAGGSGGGGSPPGATIRYCSWQGSAGESLGGGGATGQNGNDGGPGLTLNFDGNGDVEYAAGGPGSGGGDASTSPGSGGKGGAAYAAGNAGQTGIVIVRVEV